MNLKSVAGMVAEVAGRPWLYAGILAAGLVLGGAGAWQLQAWRYGAQLAEIRAQQAEAWAQAHRRRAEQARRIADIDAAESAKLKEAHDEIDRLAAAVAAGEQRLQLAATCLPAAAGGAGLDPGGTCRLTGAAEQDYYALRRAIERVTAQLRACQQILIEERQRSPP